MKMMKIHILLVSALLGSVLLLQGMTTTSTRLRQLQKLKWQTGLPKKPINVPTQEPINIPTQKSIAQTWESWFKSFFYTQPSKSISYGTEESYTSPFERGGQKRMYSASSTPKSSSWGDWAKSFFEPAGLSYEKFNQQIGQLFYKSPPIDRKKYEEGFYREDSEVRKYTSKKGHLYRYIFDKNDLELVKRLVDQMIEQHDDFKTHEMFIQIYDTPFLDDLRKERKFFAPSIKGTILDLVFGKIFSGDAFSVGMYASTNDSLNYVKLAQYLVDKGIGILPENEKLWEMGYDFLMKQYKYLYGSIAYTHNDLQEELNILKQIFKELDPILQKLMPQFANKTYKAQQERSVMEAHPEEAKRKMQDKEDREEYLRAKADHEAKQAGWDVFRGENVPGPKTRYERLKKEPFNETEYQDWLRGGKDRNFFKLEWNEFFGHRGGTQFETETYSAQDKLTMARNKLIQLLGVSTTASEKEISNAYRKFVMQYHPDVTKNPNNPMSLKLKNEINPAWDEYNEGLKQMKQEKAGRE